MVWISSILLTWFLGTKTENDMSYSSLAALGSRQAVLFQLKKIPTLTLLTLSKSDRLNQGNPLPISLGQEPLFFTRTTPMGDKLVPAWSFLGLNKGNVAVFFKIKEHSLVEVSLGSESAPSIQTIPLLFPRNPRVVFPLENDWVVVATLVTSTHCNGCNCTYFQIMDGDWKPVHCFGKGKSFSESFMKGDIPTTFWWPEEEKGGIYYNLSKDLYFYLKEGSVKIVNTHFDKKIAQKSRRSITSGLGTILLTSRTEDHVALYALEGNIWKQLDVWKGQWDDATPLGNYMILASTDGVIETRTIRSN